MAASTQRRRQRLERVFPTQPGCVPVGLFSSILRQLLAEPRAPSQQLLAAQSGVPARTIYRVLSKVDRSVSLTVADALLTALEAIYLWHEPPLDQFLLPPPPKEQLINPITPVQDRARSQALCRRTHREDN